VRAIVTDKAEIALEGGPRLLALQPGATEQEARDGCGFELAGTPVENEPLPDDARELLDRVIDPDEVRLLEIREGRAGALERLARR
jgi:hypothetical protein